MMKMNSLKKSVLIISTLLFSISSLMPCFAHGEQPENVLPADKTAGVESPRAVAWETRYEFGSVLEGTVVVHQFILENRGTESLSIERVRSSCGCTTADYAKTIAPGAAGEITVKADTRGYGGRRFNKHITVYTNDSQNRQLGFWISGDVERFVTVEPRAVYLSGNVGSEIRAVVSIAATKEHPFQIIGSETEEQLKDKIRFELAKEPDRYILTVDNLLETPGRYVGRIYFATDNADQPKIMLFVYGTISEK
ncbi:MAG: DUF1573 domain-containing protein [Deltaproteobacteria bacterium]|nr:DUF1573 domain-containing protein [Deltaproteobacteria bacterium]